MNIERKMSFWGIGPLLLFLSTIISVIAIYIAKQYGSEFITKNLKGLFYFSGTTLVLFGLALWITAGKQVDNYIRKQVLATKGVYGIVRHPVYAGAFFVFSGLFINSFSIILILTLIIIYLLLAFLLTIEEKALYGSFGEIYIIYKREVNAIIPKPKSFITAFFYPEGTKKISKNLYAIKSKDANFFIYTDGNEFICIDAGYKDKKAENELKKLGIDKANVSALFLTHTDLDHASGLSLFAKATVYMGKEEVNLINGTKARFLGVFRNRLKTKKYHLLNDNDVIWAGNIKIRTINTPGHTIGHTAYLVDDKLLFSGDSIIIQNGMIKPFYRLLNMNHKLAAKSAKKIQYLNNIELICTSHTGIADAEKYLSRKE